MLAKVTLKAALTFNTNQAGISWLHEDLPESWQKFKPSSKEFAQLTADFQQKQGLLPDGKLGTKTLNRMAMVFGVATEVQGPPAPLDGWDGPLSIVDEHIWDLKRDPDLAPDRIREVEDIVGGVAHTTGYGEGVQRLDDKFGDQARLIDEAYARRMASILEYKGTFFIGRTGYLVQFAPMKYRTHHSTSNFQAQYERSDWVKLKSVTKKGQKVKVDVSAWPKLWKGLKSPLELPAFAKKVKGQRSINNHTWSFDLLAPKPGETYTDAQYETAARLIHRVHTEYGLPIDPQHVLGHSDINPLDRSNPGDGLWDPGPRWDWSRVFDRIAELG